MEASLVITILRFYTDWSLRNLVWAAAALAGFIFLMEMVLALVIRRRKKRLAGQTGTEKKKILVYPWVFKIIRIALRFLLPYLFLSIIRRPDSPDFPWNLLFYAPTVLVFFVGILVTLYKGISLLEQKKFSDFPENSLKQQLLNVSRRGLKATLFLILLMLLFRQILEMFPGELRASGIVTGIIIANGTLFIIVLLVVVQQFFSSAGQLSIHKPGKSTSKILLKSVSSPARILILALATIWIRALVPDTQAAGIVLGQVVQFLLLTAVIVFVYQASEILGSRVSRYSDEATNTLDKTQVEMIRMILRITIVTAGIFAAIRIFTGKPVPTLIAGLGIGGLAVALAAQDTLKNFFGSLMIMSDKPFKIGERIATEGYDGFIEAIGFRSTRLRTLTGHQVIIPNDKMALASIENIGRRPNIRRLTNITVTYDTTPQKMEKALEILRGILDNHEGMPEDLPPRVFFSEFNADSLNILMIYWYSPPDFWQFMEFSEKVNLRIMTEFNNEGIKFAFPSTTTYLEQPDGQALRLDLGPEAKGWPVT